MYARDKEREGERERTRASDEYADILVQKKGLLQAVGHLHLS